MLGEESEGMRGTRRRVDERNERTRGREDERREVGVKEAKEDEE